MLSDEEHEEQARRDQAIDAIQGRIEKRASIDRLREDGEQDGMRQGRHVSILTQAVAPWLGKSRSYWGTIWAGEKFLSTFLSSNGATSTTTPEVTAITAMNLSAVWCAVLMIAGSVATMPLFFFRRTGGKDSSSRERYTDDPRYYMLHERPNPQTAKPVFWETFVAHILLWGNGYAEIVRDAAGRPRELWLIHPSQCHPVRDQTGELRYRAPGKNGQQVYLTPDQIIHVPNLSMDGLCGISTVGAMRGPLSLAMQAESFGNQFYKGGSTQRYIARYPNALTPEAHARLTQTLNVAFSKNDPVVVLEEGTEITTISIPQKDAEFMGTRMFQTEEVARAFNIPPHKLKHMDRATWANAEQMAIEFVQDTLEPHLSKIESELSYKLVLPLERRQQFVEFERDGRLAGDTAARTAALEARLKNAVINLDEWRAKEGLPPLPDGLGKTHLIQVNQTDLARLQEIIDAQIKARETPPPTPAPDPDPDEDEDEEDAVDADQARATLVRAIVTDLVPEIQRALPPPPEPAPLPALPPAAPSRITPELVAAQRAAVADVARRMWARERDKVRAAAKSPEKLREWVGAFYDRHAAVYEASLLPQIRVHCTLVESARPPEDVTRDLVQAYVDESRLQLYGLLDRQPADVATDLEALLARWDIERVNAIPDTVMREEMEHA